NHDVDLLVTEARLVVLLDDELARRLGGVSVHPERLDPELASHGVPDDPFEQGHRLELVEAGRLPTRRHSRRSSSSTTGSSRSTPATRPSRFPRRPQVRKASSRSPSKPSRPSRSRSSCPSSASTTSQSSGGVFPNSA